MLTRTSFQEKTFSRKIQFKKKQGDDVIMVNREVARLIKENEELKKKAGVDENPFKGFFIVIRPGYPGLNIMNAGGLNIRKGSVQAHPPYPVDKRVFKVLRSQESAQNYVRNVYPKDVSIKPSRITSSKTPGLKNKPSMEQMREDATQLGEDNSQKAEEAKKAAEDTKAERERIDKEAKEKELLAEKEFEKKEKEEKEALAKKEEEAAPETTETPEQKKEREDGEGLKPDEAVAEFTEADAKNLLNQNTIVVGKALQSQFKKGISTDDKVRLLVVEKAKKKSRKRIIAMIEELKVI